MKERVRVIVSGRVQGVYYRATTRRIATKLKLTGWVKNLPDGKVEVVAEGDREGLEQLLYFCRNGPPAARVDDVDVEWSDATGEFEEFEIRY